MVEFDKDKEVIVTWPESQILVEIEGYENYSEPILSEEGIKEYGSMSFIVDKDFYNNKVKNLYNI